MSMTYQQFIHAKASIPECRSGQELWAVFEKMNKAKVRDGYMVISYEGEPYIWLEMNGELIAWIRNQKKR